MTRTIEEILTPKPEARLRIYAWTPNDPPAAYAGLIKVGQTTRDDVNVRIREVLTGQVPARLVFTF